MTPAFHHQTNEICLTCLRLEQCLLNQGLTSKRFLWQRKILPFHDKRLPQLRLCGGVLLYAVGNARSSVFLRQRLQHPIELGLDQQRKAGLLYTNNKDVSMCQNT